MTTNIFSGLTMNHGLSGLSLFRTLVTTQGGHYAAITSGSCFTITDQ